MGVRGCKAGKTGNFQTFDCLRQSEQAGLILIPFALQQDQAAVHNDPPRHARFPEAELLTSPQKKFRICGCWRPRATASQLKEERTYGEPKLR